MSRFDFFQFTAGYIIEINPSSNIEIEARPSSEIRIADENLDFVKNKLKITCKKIIISRISPSSLLLFRQIKRVLKKCV